MYNETDFLMSLYKNAEMGIIGIDNLLSYQMNSKFKKLLLKQRTEYIIICDDASDLLRSIGESKERNSCFSKTMTKMVTLMMIKDYDTNKMSKLMIEGSNKGIIKVNQLLNKTQKLSKKAKELAMDHLYLLQNNIDELKPYL